MIKSKKGITLIECMLVIVIIGILVVIWGFYGRDHLKLAAMSEARMFVEKVIAQEKIYLSEHGCFVKTPGTDPVYKLDALSLDAGRSNKYYKLFKITVGVDIVVVEMHPNLEDYPDFKDFIVVGIYKTKTDIIEYNETYGKK